MSTHNNLPAVYFGPPENPRPDWRKKPDKSPDDDSLTKTPHSVKHLLGFDPIDLSRDPVPGFQEKSSAQDDSEHQQALEDTGFWGRQGAGCLILAKDTGRLLLPLRSPYVEQPGTWGTWGGAIDKDEAPKVAVRRELTEEVGFKGAVKLIPLKNFVKGTFCYHNFLTVVPHEFKPTLNWETSKATWVDYGKWPKPLHFGLQFVLSDRPSEKIIQAQIPKLQEKGSVASKWWQSPSNNSNCTHMVREAKVKKMSIVSKVQMLVAHAAGTPEWWSNLSEEKRAAYIYKHPDSKFASHPTATVPELYHTTSPLRAFKNNKYRKVPPGTLAHTVTHGVAGEKPHAYADFVEHPDHIYIDKLVTQNKHRGKGHASAILNHIKKYADDAGKEVRLLACTLDWNDRIAGQKREERQAALEKFYRKHGFRCKNRLIPKTRVMTLVNMTRPVGGKK